LTKSSPPQAAGLEPVRQGGFLVGFSQKIRSLVDQEHLCYSIGIPRGLAKMEYQRDEHRVHFLLVQMTHRGRMNPATEVNKWNKMQ
jgi:hypothetical protein